MQSGSMSVNACWSNAFPTLRVLSSLSPDCHTQEAREPGKNMSENVFLKIKFFDRFFRYLSGLLTYLEQLNNSEVT